MYHIENFIATIPVSQYKTEYRDVSKFIEFCKVCPQYKKSWACPPFLFDADEYLSNYQIAYILGTKITLPHSFHSSTANSEELIKATERIIKAVRLDLDIQLLRVEKQLIGSKAFFAGACHFCSKEECTRRLDKSCLYPEKVRPSLESFGFDIGKTTEELLGIKLQWSSKNHPPEYLTLVSGLFTQIPVEKIEAHFPELFSKVKSNKKGII